MTFFHPGTHKYPAEAPELIVRFFKEHLRRAPAQDKGATQSLRKAVNLYASFDDVGGGELTLSTAALPTSHPAGRPLSRT